MADISKVKLPDNVTYNLKDSGAVRKSGDTMTGALIMAGTDIQLKTTGSSSDDSSDIAWYYGNGYEKCRLWTDNSYTSKSGLNYRLYKSDGTSLYNGTIPLADGTGASGTWGINISGNAATATKATQDGDGNIIKSTYLKLSGGTLTGAVYSINNIWTKRTGYTVDTSSNNNCTTSVEGDFGFVDNNGYWSSRVANTNDTAGKTNIYLQVRNKKTDGTEVTNQLQLGVTKAGARTVTVSDASVWRSALGLGTTTASGTTGRIAYYSGANAISSSGGLKYYTANSTATSPATQTVLEIFGVTYGNDAAYLKSGTAGVLSYGDGCPQIRMSPSENGGQNGALMFTDHDKAGTGASFHFVSDQSDWNVTSKRFHARTGISIGTNLPQNWNGLQVQGANQNWLNVGKSPVIYMKKSDGGASGALGMDTKTGRVVIATYPANDDLLYFNWYDDTTLAGTDNKYDAQMKWTPSTNTLSTNISGTAAIANKLGSSNVGSATQPIYLSAGTATACTYTLGKSVPSDAVFTDTNTHRPIQVNGTEILGNNTTVLNLKAGSNITLTNSSGTVTIAGTANNAVTQTKTTTDANYDILFSVSTSGTDTKVEGARKSDKIKFNPSQQTLTIGSGNDESVISNVDIKAKQYELRSPDKTLLVKMKLDNTGQTAILAEDSEGTMLWYNNYINSDGTLQWNNPITCSEAFSCANFLSGQIELKQASPYIDFHHNNSTADFTSRIITTNLAELTFYGKNSSGTTVYGTCRGAAFTVVSSKYMKENIKDIEDDEAKKLLQLRPVSFDYKYTGETNKRGLIAEEVLEVMPEMVYVPEDYSEPMDDTIPDNVPSIDYSKFVPYLIKMVQIQQKEIDELKARI